MIILTKRPLPYSLDMCSLTIAADFGVALIPRIAISFPSAVTVWRSGNALVNLYAEPG